jgi:hypothetical protein
MKLPCRWEATESYSTERVSIIWHHIYSQIHSTITSLSPAVELHNTQSPQWSKSSVSMLSATTMCKKELGTIISNLQNIFTAVFLSSNLNICRCNELNVYYGNTNSRTGIIIYGMLIFLSKTGVKTEAHIWCQNTWVSSIFQIHCTWTVQTA